MRKAFEYFDKVFLINLDKRKDRLDRCNNIFEQNSVMDLVERFPGIVPNPSDDIPYTKDTEKIKIPLYGCLLSHINIIKRAKEEGLKSVLVLEDDVDFINIDSVILQIVKIISISGDNLLFLNSINNIFLILFNEI
jgi:GR25 family glycosyltransferase involved in LPS biosynthesis